MHVGKNKIRKTEARGPRIQVSLVCVMAGPEFKDSLIYIMRGPEFKASLVCIMSSRTALL